MRRGLSYTGRTVLQCNVVQYSDKFMHGIVLHCVVLGGYLTNIQRSGGE